MALYLEDLKPGMTFTTAPITITEEESIAFAKQYDPQPFHTDPQAAKDTLFQGLAVSGWHLAAISMRALATSSMANIANGLVGVEIRRLRWPQPTRPGDTVRVTVEVIETKESKSRPGWGTAVVVWDIRNQRDETVMELENVIWVACRPANV